MTHDRAHSLNVGEKKLFLGGSLIAGDNISGVSSVFIIKAWNDETKTRLFDFCRRGDGWGSWELRYVDGRSTRHIARLLCGCRLDRCQRWSRFALLEFRLERAVMEWRLQAGMGDSRCRQSADTPYAARRCVESSATASAGQRDASAERQPPRRAFASVSLLSPKKH